MNNKVIILEGAQGVGKTTITRILREQMPYSVLLSLSGTSDKTKDGELKIFKEHFSSLNMIDACKGCNLNFILDRSFLTERVYCSLGFKDFDFQANCDNLLNYLHHIANDYEVYVVLLTATKDEFARRLNRDKPEFLDIGFNALNSLNQQNEYKRILKEIKRRYNDINCIEVNTVDKDPYDIAYDIKEGSF